MQPAALVASSDEDDEEDEIEAGETQLERMMSARRLRHLGYTGGTI